MKNKFITYIIATILLFILSALCFRIMKIGGELQGITAGYKLYYFNTIWGLIGLILYNILKVFYDKMFNKIYKTYITKGKRIGLILLYIWISLVLWIFVFFKSDIGGGLTNLYQFKISTIQGLYIIDILFVIPLWNFIYNIYRGIRKKIMLKNVK